MRLCEAGVVNLHVLTTGSEDIERILLFRDRLRANPADRALYVLTKRELAARRWTYVQHYADAKAEARRTLERLEIHCTPKHGNWLDMAEIELSVLVVLAWAKLLD